MICFEPEYPLNQVRNPHSFDGRGLIKRFASILNILMEASLLKSLFCFDLFKMFLNVIFPLIRH